MRCRGRPAPGGQPWRRGTFLSGQAVSLLGDGLAALAVPLLVLELSRSPLVSALSAASVTVGYLMVGLPAGVLVDRVDPWRVLLLTDALRAGLFAALFGFAAAGRQAVWLVLVIAFAAGACSVFSQTALAVVVRDLFPAAGHGDVGAGRRPAAGVPGRGDRHRGDGGGGLAGRAPEGGPGRWRRA
ncbi:MAG TPA: MFS transporter [Streptosporangiaceae bacterium]